MSVMSAETPAGGLRTVEGRLTMVDLGEDSRRCRIEPPSGRPVRCTFDAAREAAVLGALGHSVRVAGAMAKLGARTSILHIATIETTEDAAPTARLPKAVCLDDVMAARGGARPTDLDKLMGGTFWPKNESTDEFLEWLDAERERS